MLRTPQPITFIELKFNFIEESVANIGVYYYESFVREFTKGLGET
jgi:hypothetical protein